MKHDAALDRARPRAQPAPRTVASVRGARLLVLPDYLTAAILSSIPAGQAFASSDAR